MSVAFVLSGGGSLGAVQVGMLQALQDRGVRPDLLVGTSAGAINAAYLAGHGMSPQSLQELHRMWRSLHRRDIFPFALGRAVLALSGARPSLFAPDRLHELVQANLGFRDIAHAAIELRVVGTDLISGKVVLLSDGDAVTAVMASAAIPGILPPVCRAGRVLVDGGLADHGEVLGSTAEAVDEIYVLPAGSACALPRAPSSALGVAAQALTLLIQQRLVSAVSRYTGRAKINVLPPLCPLSVPAVDFGHADELISRAHRATAHWLDTGGTDLPQPARFLSLHDHRAPTSHPTPAPTGGSVSRR